jgi:hypothetical protein
MWTAMNDYAKSDDVSMKSKEGGRTIQYAVWDIQAYSDEDTNGWSDDNL